jgi:hypothetical protein
MPAGWYLPIFWHLTIEAARRRRPQQELNGCIADGRPEIHIYAADYKLSGVAFKTLFDYIRRTESKLILPRIIREEVVIGFGRRLKREWKLFSEAHRKYALMDIDNALSRVNEPVIGRSMTRVRRKLMKPSDEVVPIYVADTTGVNIDEVFMRGVHRLRPANDEGEELRDVVIWLWVLAYTKSAAENVAFVSQDGGFWNGDSPHPNITHDITHDVPDRLSIYKTIDDFVKKHAPAPTTITPEWFEQHFTVADFAEVLPSATGELSNKLAGPVRDVTVDQLNFVSGFLYEVATDVQFVELNLSLSLSFTNIAPSPGQYPVLGGSLGAGPINLYEGFVNSPQPRMGTLADLANLSALERIFKAGQQPAQQPARKERHLHAKAEAKFSARIKAGALAEISLDELKIDARDIYRQLYGSSEPDRPAEPA